ncbi:DUF6480 family protein [Streptomyces sp. NBC_00487]|uniref:DUF6480 family protein n=1 Tax=unclassified Streptomyces TaxID=2593676 RepID=UPI002E192074|nr:MULTISPECIES: DUF6480 family protein [unclassified Streptomyces]
MTTPDPDPRPTPGAPDRPPRRTPGVEAHGGVPPGETPPAEGGTYGISHPEPPELRKGWGPMPLVLIMAVVALIAIGLIGMAVSLML